MISLHLHKKKPAIDSKKDHGSGLFRFGISQKGPSNIIGFRKQQNKEPLRKIEQNDKQKRIIINDENCSYQANLFEQEDDLKNKFSEDSKITGEICLIKSSVHEKDREMMSSNALQQTKGNNVIDLKKKIKKSSSVNVGRNNFFREKVAFKSKTYKFFESQKTEQNSDSQSMMMQIEEGIQQFVVYKDSEVFPGLKGQQLRKRIVPQRMDNDNQTDDEQIEKFRNIVIKQFTDYVQQQINAEKASSQLEKQKQIQSQLN